MEIKIGQTYNQRYIALDRKAHRTPVVVEALNRPLGRPDAAVSSVRVHRVDSPITVYTINPMVLEPLA